MHFIFLPFLGNFGSIWGIVRIWHKKDLLRLERGLMHVRIYKERACVYACARYLAFGAAFLAAGFFGAAGFGASALGSSAFGASGASTSTTGPSRNLPEVSCL